MLRQTLILMGSVLFLFTGCGKNEPQPQKATETPTIQMNKEVKKAPKRTVKKRYFKKKKLKYRDTSESSQVRLYNPETKTPIKAQEDQEIIPTSAGGQLFFAKKCNLCHKPIENRLGPSIKKLARGYKNKSKELILYLQRKGDAIIQPERGSIMNTQLAKLRILSQKEYNDLAQYILTGGKVK